MKLLYKHNGLTETVRKFCMRKFGKFKSVKNAFSHVDTW
jgi:hypothetical protein